MSTGLSGPSSGGGTEPTRGCSLIPCRAPTQGTLSPRPSRSVLIWFRLTSASMGEPPGRRGCAGWSRALAADGDHQAGSRSVGATLPFQSLVMSAARGLAPRPARGSERLSGLACPVSLPRLPPGALCVRKGPQGRWRGFKSRLPFTGVWPWAHCFPSGFDFVTCCPRVRRYLRLGGLQSQSGAGHWGRGHESDLAWRTHMLVEAMAARVDSGHADRSRLGSMQ